MKAWEEAILADLEECLEELEDELNAMLYRKEFTDEYKRLDEAHEHLTIAIEALKGTKK